MSEDAKSETAPSSEGEIGPKPERDTKVLWTRALAKAVKGDALKILSWQHIREVINANA